MNTIARALLTLFVVLLASETSFARQSVDGVWEMDAGQGITCSNGVPVAPAIQHAFFMRYANTQLSISGKTVQKSWTLTSPVPEYVVASFPLIVEYNKIIIRHRGTTIADAEISPVGNALEFRSEDFEFDLCLNGNERGTYRIVFRYIDSYSISH